MIDELQPKLNQKSEGASLGYLIGIEYWLRIFNSDFITLVKTLSSWISKSLMSLSPSPVLFSAYLRM